MVEKRLQESARLSGLSPCNARIAYGWTKLRPRLTPAP
jgi:hypothetical protein